jgi:hypothetical protein
MWFDGFARGDVTLEDMALAILLAVLLFVVLLIAAFIFPPTRWAKAMTKHNKK